jgi:uncharacterized SAM-binding protein YcdF (DUF218 family)
VIQNSEQSKRFSFLIGIGQNNPACGARHATQKIHFETLKLKSPLYAQISNLKSQISPLNIMPLRIFWLLLLAGIVFYILKRRRTSLICWSFSIVWLFIISFTFLPELLVKSLENRFPSLLTIPQFNPKDSVNILVLGSGYTENRILPPNDQLSLNSLCRLTEAIRLHKLLNKSRIVLFGSASGENVTGPEPFIATALALGVNRNDIYYLGRPKNTQMEAFDYTNTFGTDRKLVLVTDAVHMPRAMFLFRLSGQSPIAAPTNHLVKSDRKEGISEWGPSSSNIAMMEYCMHEIGGLIYARLFFRRLGYEW